jgi:hypothetical protein
MRSAIVGAIMLDGVASGTVYAQEVGDDEGGGESGPGCGRPQWVCVHEPSHKNQGPAPSGLSELHGACLYCLPWGDPEDCHDSCLISPEPAYQLEGSAPPLRANSAPSLGFWRELQTVASLR